MWSYIRANDMNCVSLEQLKPAGSIVGEGFPFLPGTLRGKILQVDGEALEVPNGLQENLRIEVRSVTGETLIAWESPIPALFAQRLELSWEGATADDQATLDSYGGVFETPPYLIDLKPVLKVSGSEQASGTAIGSAEEVEIYVTLTAADGVSDVFVHDGYAGEPSVLVTDFSGLSQQLLGKFQEQQLLAAGTGDAAVAEAATLQLLGVTYLYSLGRDLEDLAGWNWHRLVRLVSEGLIVQTGAVTTTAGGSPLSFTRAERFVDFPGFILGLFHAGGETGFVTSTMELAGAQGSYLEGEVFNQVLQRHGIAAVSALTQAQREGQLLTRVDGSNLDAVLAAI
ncbi:MAG: hypothetical protein GY856_25225, partial [bacterium]|nr:hypothetical protein [bacterium]